MGPRWNHLRPYSIFFNFSKLYFSRSSINVIILINSTSNVFCVHWWNVVFNLQFSVSSLLKMRTKMVYLALLTNIILIWLFNHNVKILLWQNSVSIATFGSLFCSSSWLCIWNHDSWIIVTAQHAFGTSHIHLLLDARSINLEIGPMKDY